MENKWNPDISEINFSDDVTTQWHIDTRDFGFILSQKVFDAKTLENDFRQSYVRIKKPKYFPTHFWTPEEAKEIIDKLFKDSGGEAKWRMLSIPSVKGDGMNWKLKYIRIYKTPNGLIFVNNEKEILSKELLNSPINQEYLHTH